MLRMSCCDHFSSVIRPSVNIFKRLLLWSPWANFAQISYGASLGWGNKKLLKWSWSIDQDGHHAHIWLKIFFSRTEDALGLNLCISHRGREIYQNCLNKGCILTFDLFTAMSSLLPYAFIWEKPLKILFSKTEDAIILATLVSWTFTYIIGNRRSTKVAKIMVVHWHLTFLR